MPLHFPKPFLPWPTSAVEARERGASKLPLDPHGHRMPVERSRDPPENERSLSTIVHKRFGWFQSLLVEPVSCG